MCSRSRTIAFDTIGRLRREKPKESRPELLTLLAHRDLAVRQYVLDSFKKLRGKEARIAAWAGLADPSPIVRCEAVELLGELGFRTDVSRLMPALKDSDWTVRASAASSLASIGGAVAIMAVRKALKRDRHPHVRRYAAVALADLNDEGSISLLQWLLSRDNRPWARSGLIAALYAIAGSHYLPQFLELLRHDDPLVRCHGATLIGEYARDEDAVTAITELDQLQASERNGVVREAVTESLDVLRRAYSLVPQTSVRTTTP